MFEMEHENQVSAILHAARGIITSEQIFAMLNKCVLSKHQKHNECLRDTLGFLFRLHAIG